MRMHSNIAVYPNRRLVKQYDNAGTAAGTTKAIGISAPTLRAQAMGMSGNNGVVTILARDGGNQVYTLHAWHEGMARILGGNGWVKNGANSAEYTKVCDQLSLISFTTTEDTEFFIQVATTPVTDAFVSGVESGKNANTDKSGVNTI